MKFPILLCLGLCIPTWAHALDNTQSVQVTTLLKTTQSWDGKNIVLPKDPAEITALQVEIAPGGETGWHQHPVPSFAMVLDGTLEVQLKNGSSKTVHAGEAFAEVVDTLHNGRNVGKTPVKLVVFYTGTVGKPLTIKP